MQQRQQIQPRCIQRCTTKLQQFAGHCQHANAKHVVHGEPIFQAVHAAGIFRDIAAN